MNTQIDKLQCSEGKRSDPQLSCIRFLKYNFKFKFISIHNLIFSFIECKDEYSFDRNFKMHELSFWPNRWLIRSSD